MIFMIHASKGAETIETHRTSASIAVSQARMLRMAGWQVKIIELRGTAISSDNFDQLLQRLRAGLEAGEL